MTGEQGRPQTPRCARIKFIMTMRKLVSVLFIILMIGLFGTHFFVVPARADDTGATQQQLEQQLQDIEKQILVLEKQLATTASQKKTLASQIKKLQTKQDQLRLQIKATNLKLNKIAKNIAVTEVAVASTRATIQDQQRQVAVFLRLMNQQDETPWLVLITEAGGLNKIFTEIQNYIIISSELGRLTKAAKTSQVKLEGQVASLTDAKNDTTELLQIKIVQQAALGGQLTEQSDLLVETKGKESNFQSLLTDSRKAAAEIRGRIYELFGTTKNIDFGQAVAIAEFVAAKTGIRPAFLLAILTQESNLGKNVGTCNRIGDPPEKSWKVVMKPERDQEPFLKITQDLGLDTDTTPVSCPLKDKKGKQFGWGGAMGPAQFIPSTWMGYTAKVSALTGKTPANPWDIRDAFAASAIKLTHDGADGTSEGEWKAAMKYFSGSTNTRYRFYGDNVLTIAEGYEKDIQALKNQ
ncbi:MAG: hypothetical protein EXS55_00525 [Candidatus Magasanikbacteria bacterium]|nr:hypothetical protein [Candidatus Magasanikbacteria bacterium]